MKEKVSMHRDFAVHNEVYNSLWLLLAIRAISYQFDQQRNIFLAIDDTKSKLFAHCQAPGTSLADYYKEFTNMVEVLEYYGESFGDDKALTDAMKLKYTAEC